MNVKPTFADQCRSLTQDMLTAIRTGDDPAYDAAAAEARALIQAQADALLAAKPAQTAPAPEEQDAPVRPGYAAALAHYAAAKTVQQVERRFDELCLLRADEIVLETGDPDTNANLFELYDIDGHVVRIITSTGLPAPDALTRKLEVLA